MNIPDGMSFVGVLAGNGNMKNERKTEENGEDYCA